MLGGSILTGYISIVYVVLNMRIILITMDLSSKSAATYRPRKSPITTYICILSRKGRHLDKRNCFLTFKRGTNKTKRMAWH